MEQFLFVKQDFGTLVLIKTLALIFLILVYCLKAYLLTRYRVIKEISIPKGDIKKGIITSLSVIVCPSAMESTRDVTKNWLEFFLFHVGILIAIVVSFMIPYAPNLLQPAVTTLFMIIMGLGFIAGFIRIIKKFTRPDIKLISSKDDFFSIIIITIFLLLGAMSMTGNREIIVAFLALTAFLLVYVPLSKISHYLYWPFARYYMGKHFGRRGIYMKRR